ESYALGLERALLNLTQEGSRETVPARGRSHGHASHEHGTSLRLHRHRSRDRVVEERNEDLAARYPPSDDRIVQGRGNICVRSKLILEFFKCSDQNAGDSACI